MHQINGNSYYWKSRAVKSLAIRLGIPLIAAILLSLAFIPGLQKTNAASRDIRVIALINEDMPAEFNGHEYNFGKEFTNLISTDDSYDWKILSRNVAEKSFSNKSVSSLIYLPSSFSKDILTLQKVNPTKASVNFKVADGISDSTSQLLHSKINSIINKFNTQIVKVYYGSIAGNITDAHDTMDSIISSQSGLLKTVSGNIYPGLNKENRYHDVTSTYSDSLKKQNSDWTTQHNNFVDKTKNALNSTGKDLTEKQTSLSSYFQEQNDIMQANLDNANKGIVTQNASDKNFYGTNFQNFNYRLIHGSLGWNGFNGLSATNSSGTKTGIIGNLEKNIATYNSIISEKNGKGGIINDIQTQINSLENSSDKRNRTGSIPDLEKLEATLLSEYGNKKVDIDDDNYSSRDIISFSKTDAANALVAKIQNSLGKHSQTVENYQNQIKELLKIISIEPSDYNQLFTLLKNSKRLSDDQIKQYIDKLNLLARYKESAHVSTPALGLVKTNNAKHHTEKRPLTVTVPSGEKYIVTAAASQGSSVTAVVDGMPINTNRYIIDNEKTDGSHTVTIDYTIDFGDNESAQVSFDIKDDKDNVISSQSNDYLLMPQDDDIKNNFAAINSYLSNIDVASNLLLFLYGKPGQQFNEYMKTTEAEKYSFTAEQSSVYNRYDSISPADILAHFWRYGADGKPRMNGTEHLFTDDVNDFYTLGVFGINQIKTNIRSLLHARKRLQNNLDKLSHTLLPQNYFSKNITELNNWYSAAMSEIETNRDKWDEAKPPVSRLLPVQWHGEQQNKGELYYDEKDSNSLFNSLTELISSTSKKAIDISDSAKAIDNRSEAFDALKKNADAAKENTNNILATTSQVISKGNDNLKKNDSYNKNFDALLGNARTAGADTAKIYDFLANPIASHDQTAPTQHSLIPQQKDYRLPLSLLAAGLILCSVIVFNRNKIKAAYTQARRSLL